MTVGRTSVRPVGVTRHPRELFQSPEVARFQTCLQCTRGDSRRSEPRTVRCERRTFLWQNGATRRYILCSPAPRSTNMPTRLVACLNSVSYTHLRAHETPEHLVCRLLLEKKKK